MLVVGMPRAASTSIQKTLSVYYGFGFGTSKIRTKHLKRFEEMSRPHRHAGNISREDARRLAAEKTVYCLHLIPTKHNVRLLSEVNIKTPVFLREPVSDAESHLRVGKFRKKIKLPHKLADELKDYYESWQSVCSKKVHFKAFYYKDLKTNYKKFMNDVICFMDGTSNMGAIEVFWENRTLGVKK